MTGQSLGSETIQGIGACGHPNTITQKDGSPGISTETWFSREDIGGLLYKSSNPQTGQNITQLVNVRFNEPDPGLFEPPVNYRVVDETKAFTIRGPTPVSQTSEDQPAPRRPNRFALTGMPCSGDLMSGSAMIGTNYRDSMGRTRSKVSLSIPSPATLMSSIPRRTSHIAGPLPYSRSPPPKLPRLRRPALRRRNCPATS